MRIITGNYDKDILIIWISIYQRIAQNKTLNAFESQLRHATE